MSLRQEKEEKDLKCGEEIRGDKGITEVLEAQCEEKKHKIKIPKPIKMKNIMKHRKNSEHEAVLSSKAIDEDFDIIESIANSPGETEEECQKSKIKIKISEKILQFKKWRKNSKSPETPSAASLDFNGNLEQNRLAEAQQQLVEAEERLFGSNDVARTEDEEDKLQTDYEIFILQIRFVIQDSFNEENQETLKSALTAILKEEKQDRRWAEVAEDRRPVWRPRKCRQIHDTLLQSVVEGRLKDADEQENKADKLSSSLKREVCRMGKQVQKDLLKVVQNLKECYPPDFDICRTYVQLYHQTFSTTLQELARSSIDFEDCFYLLNWIKNYYPKDILKHKELEEHINSSSLGPLLPEQDCKRLEEQYFSYKESEVSKWLSIALEKEVEKWGNGIEPDLMDGYYFSSLAVDVIPLIDVTVKEVSTLLGCESKAGSILCQLDSFLLSYRENLKELLKRKQENIPKTLSATLVNIYQFREYVQRKHPFSADTRATLLSTLADLKNICHTYFLSQIHTDLKPVYRKLWTQVWFAGNCEVVENLVKALENIIDDLKEIKPACREELLAELHVNVIVEYVRRMMKRKLKLKDKEQQEAAAEFLCNDCHKICAVFAKVGSKEEWLSKIPSRLSEILRLQDPGSLELEIATLAIDYPDISEQHVLALLNLKTNLSSSDLRKIKGCFNENRRPDTESSTSFFSKVLVKRKII